MFKPGFTLKLLFHTGLCFAVLLLVRNIAGRRPFLQEACYNLVVSKLHHCNFVYKFLNYCLRMYCILESACRDCMLFCNCKSYFHLNTLYIVIKLKLA